MTTPLTAAQKQQIDNSYPPGGIKLGTRISDLESAGLYLIKKAISTTDLTTAGVTQTLTFDDAIPANAVVLSRWVEITALFTGGGATGAALDFGDGTDTDGYYNDENLFNNGTGIKAMPGSTGSLIAGAAIAGADISASARTPNLSVTSDVNVNTLTTGSLTAFIVYAALPLGATI